MTPGSADDLLGAVHRRIGGGIDIQTFSEGGIEVRWRRSYGEELSDERFASARSLLGALRAVLRHEDEADAADALEAAP